MKQVQAETGGRPFANDDLVVMQQEITAAVQAQFLGKGSFILSGCTVTGTSVSAGIVCLDGQLLRFAGQANVNLPAQFQAGTALLTDPRPYQTGGTKYCMREVPAVLVARNPAYAAGEFLPIDTWGGKTWAHIVASSGRKLGEVRMLMSYVASDYDMNGLGKPGTASWGWGLCNSQGGRVDMGGRVPVGLDTNRADYDTPGKQGGSENITLTTPQMPAHNHSNGAYTKILRMAPQPNAQGGNTPIGFDDGGPGELDIRFPGDLQPSGGGQSHENRQPFGVLTMEQWVGF